MADFDPFQLAEDRLATFEVVNLPTYEQALTSVITDVNSEVASLADEITHVQSDLRDYFTEHKLSDLKTNYRRSEQHLNLITSKVTQIDDEFVKTCKMLHDYEIHKDNAITVFQLLNELMRLNGDEDSEIESMEPLAIIKLKYVLEKLDLPAYTLAQKALERKFLQMRTELLDSMQSQLSSGDTKKLKEKFDLLVEFDAQKQALALYASHLVKGLFFKVKPGLDVNQFAENLRDFLRDLLNMFETEVVLKYDSLKDCFGNCEEIVSLLMIETLEVKLKPELFKALDTDSISAAIYLQFLVIAFTEVRATVSQLELKCHELGLDQKRILRHLMDNIFGVFRKSYYSNESSHIKQVSQGLLMNLIEPLDDGRMQGKGGFTFKIPQMGGETEEVTTKLNTLWLMLNKSQVWELLRAFETSVSRCSILAFETEKSKFLFELINLALDSLCNSFLDNFFTQVNDVIAFCDCSRVKHTSRLFEILTRASAVFKDVSLRLKNIIKTSGIQSEEQERCKTLKANLMRVLELKIVKLFTLCINLVISSSRKLLSTEQKRSDFLSSEIGTSDNTPACELVTEFMTEHISTLKRALQPAQAQILLSTISRDFIRMLREHIEKYVISQEKALLLSSDMNKYKNIILLCQDEREIEEFERFRQLINLFMLPAGSLHEFVSEEPIASMDMGIVVKFIGQREDFKTEKLDRFCATLLNNRVDK
mmetsp:Transcript_10641/g.20586  ORF Transcript_10641/g.20586 Transcript_10641/m.20586 type:complete len:708 (-) Transcript_10641:23-2146(-)